MHQDITRWQHGNKTKTASLVFRLEAAQLVVDQHYTVREAAEAMNVGYSRAWINGFVSYAKSVMAKALAIHHTRSAQDSRA